MKTRYDGTKTLENLKKALAGESEARTKYDFFSSQAKKDGYEQIAAIFAETALNEKEHAKMWFKELHGGAVEPTEENLQAAADGENGMICTWVLRRLRARRGLTIWLRNLRQWQQSKRRTKKDT